LTAGSLLKRTLLSVGAFVVGSAAFVTIASLVLVSVARGVLPSQPSSSSSSSTQQGDSDSVGIKTGSKLLRPKKGRAGGDDGPSKSSGDDSNKDE